MTTRKRAISRISRPVEGLVRDLIKAAADVLHHDDDILEGDSDECVCMRKRLTENFRAVLKRHRIANKCF